jgi:peptidoglycan/xylan/chitin deacetylase (PgdA/CDA1 family)
MRPRRDPVPRAKEAWVWIGGTALLGLLGAGVTVAATLLWENIDIRQLTPGLTIPSGPLPAPAATIAPAVDQRAFSAVMFNSPRNRAYFPDAAHYNRELNRWRTVIRGVGGSLRDVADVEQLRGVRADELLVLAEAPCVSPQELAAIRAHVARGGSVVANWAFAARDGECEWRGWAPLIDLTDADDVRELPARAGLYLTVPAGIPLAIGLDPGARIELRPDPSLALRVRGMHAYWSDWLLNPMPAEGSPNADAAAIATRTPDGGRVAWLGWSVSQAATDADSLRSLRVVQNAILWAAGTPSAAVAAWPSGARAAMVFALDVEDQARNAIDAAALFVQERIPATFFVVTKLTEGDSSFAAALIAAGEVGTHTVDHSPLGGLTAQDQMVRLRRSYSEVKGWTGVAPVGLRPPEESFDSLTLEAWKRAGGEYVVARNDGRTGSPEIHHTSRGIVVLIPRLIKDDYNVIVQDASIRAERIAEAFVEGANKLHAIGGVAVVAGHTQIMETGRRMDGFRIVAESARAQGGWWMAQGAQVARWWRARALTQIEFTPAAPLPARSTMTPAGISDILVRGSADDPLADAWLEIVLPQGSARLLPLLDGQPVDFARTEWGMRAPVGTLQPGQTRRISFVVDTAATTARRTR